MNMRMCLLRIHLSFFCIGLAWREAFTISRLIGLWQLVLWFRVFGLASWLGRNIGS